MALPGVENVPISQEAAFKLSRGPQRLYIEKSEKYRQSSNLLILAYSPHRGTTPFGTTPSTPG